MVFDILEKLSDMVEMDSFPPTAPKKRKRLTGNQRMSAKLNRASDAQTYEDAGLQPAGQTSVDLSEQPAGGSV